MCMKANQNPDSRIMVVTIAGPSVGAFDIHTKVSTGNLFWQNGGNLKGVIYDFVHMNTHPTEEDTDFGHYSEVMLPDANGDYDIAVTSVFPTYLHHPLILTLQKIKFLV